jgi:hypothetical protein
MTTGAKIWGSDVSIPQASTNADIVVMNDGVYVATTNGLVQKYYTDGTPGPSYNTGASVDQPLLALLDGMYITPAANKLYARKYDMTAKWAAAVTLAAANTGPAYRAFDGVGELYVAAGTRVQKVLDGGTSGSVDWSYDATATVRSGPIVYRNTVYFGRDGGYYYAVARSNAALTGDWPYRTANGNCTSGPWIFMNEPNSLVIFGTDAGDIHAFDAD